MRTLESTLKTRRRSASFRFREETAAKVLEGSGTSTVRVPVANLFTEATVDFARQRKAAILAQIERRIRSDQ